MMTSLLSKTALALLLLTGAASAQPPVCHITATNVRASPGGPIIGWFDYETPIQVVNTAYPWLYVQSPYGEGWVWGRYVNPICLPDPCCIPCPTCGIVGNIEPHHHHPSHPHYNHHEKGEYQEHYQEAPAPAPAPAEPAPPLEPAPPVAVPGVPNCYQSDAGCNPH